MALITTESPISARDAAAPRETWTTPALRRMDASTSEFSPNVNVDGEGHS